MKIVILAIALWAGSAAALLAVTVEERLIAGLQAQGYVILEEGTTFLGRLRIVAQNDLYRRELVVNPGTGEVLRDYATLLSNRMPPDTAIASSGSRRPRSQTASPPVDMGVASLAPDGPAFGNGLNPMPPDGGGMIILPAQPVLPMAAGTP